MKSSRKAAFLFYSLAYHWYGEMNKLLDKAIRDII